MKTTATRYSPELRERAVRMVLEHQGDHGSQWAAIASIAGKVGCTPESLRRWVRQAERDRGLRRGQTCPQDAGNSTTASSFITLKLLFSCVGRAEARLPITHSAIQTVDQGPP